MNIIQFAKAMVILTLLVISSCLDDGAADQATVQDLGDQSPTLNDDGFTQPKILEKDLLAAKEGAIAGTTSTASLEVVTEVTDVSAKKIDGAAEDPQHSDKILMIKKDVAAVTMASILDESSKDDIVSHLVLPKKGHYGSQITWSSDVSNVTETGRVTRPEYGDPDVKAILTAIFYLEAYIFSKSFTLMIKSLPPSDKQIVDEVLASITETSILGDNKYRDAIIGDLSLQQTQSELTKIVWNSANSAINDEGKVTRTTIEQGDSNGDLTVTVSHGPVSKVKVFALTVWRQLPQLIITEVSPGRYRNRGWFELYNTTDKALNLNAFQVLRCPNGDRENDADGNNYDCAGEDHHRLPNAMIAGKSYVIIHSGDEIDGKSEFYIPDLRIDGRRDFIELQALDGTFIDYVRWWSPSTPDTFEHARVPSDATFEGESQFSDTNFGISITRTFPYHDSDKATDWVYTEFATPGGATITIDRNVTIDTDGDGLSDRAERNIHGTDPRKADTDGDGFSDGQEVLESGVSGINIRAMGAQPLVRDVFVEIDTMKDPKGLTNSRTDVTTSPYSLRLRKESLDRIVKAFDSYKPDENDRNQHPIRIHFDVGDLFHKKSGLDANYYDLGGGNQLPFSRCLYIGVDATRTASTCSNIYAIKGRNFDLRRKYVFHYFVVAWSQNPDGSTGSGGLAEYPGNDGLISFGGWYPDKRYEHLVILSQAIGLMHELGHNFELDHGGGDSIHRKPNYHSIMNYLYAPYGLDHNDNGDIFYFANRYQLAVDKAYYLENDPTSGFGVIDYSYGRNKTLDERALIEKEGWRDVGIDFDNSGSIRQDSREISVNLNPRDNQTAIDVMHDYDDWGNLNLLFQRGLYTESFSSQK